VTAVALLALKIDDMVPSSVVLPIHPGPMKYYREPRVRTARELAGSAHAPRPHRRLDFSGMVSPSSTAARATGHGSEDRKRKVFALRM
jgi:hypothetical protein